MDIVSLTVVVFIYNLADRIDWSTLKYIISIPIYIIDIARHFVGIML